MRPTFPTASPPPTEIHSDIRRCSAWSVLIAIGLDRRALASNVPHPAGNRLCDVLLCTVSSCGYAGKPWGARGPGAAERGHHVIPPGRTAIVPIPCMAVHAFFFAPACWARGGVALTHPLFALLFAVRTGSEEAALAAALPDSADYPARVAPIVCCPDFGENTDGGTTRLMGLNLPDSKTIPAASLAAGARANSHDWHGGPLQVFDLHQEGLTYLSGAATFSAPSPAPARQSTRIPVQQARHPPSTLLDWRRRNVLRSPAHEADGSERWWR